MSEDKLSLPEHGYFYEKGMSRSQEIQGEIDMTTPEAKRIFTDSQLRELTDFVESTTAAYDDDHEIEYTPERELVEMADFYPKLFRKMLSMLGTEMWISRTEEGHLGCHCQVLSAREPIKENHYWHHWSEEEENHAPSMLIDFPSLLAGQKQRCSLVPMGEE